MARPVEPAPSTLAATVLPPPPAELRPSARSDAGAVAPLGIGPDEAPPPSAGQDDAAPGEDARTSSSRLSVPAIMAITLPTAVSLGLVVHQMRYPGALNGIVQYDDGVYFGSAVRLLHGVVPYRDFAFVAPPGITILMLPFAWLADAVGTATALGAARVFTELMLPLQVVLVGLLLRHKRPATILAGTALTACAPAMFGAGFTVLLEPYLCVFALGGLLAIFWRGRVSGTLGCVAGGALLGFACCVKLWAVPLALLVVVACCVAARRRVLPILLGLAVGFGGPALGFVVAAPHAFWHDVVATQYSRAAGGSHLRQLRSRFGGILGLRLVDRHVSQLAAAGGTIGVLAVLTGAVVAGAVARRWSLLDSVLISAGAASAALLLAPHEFYPHYLAFPQPFLAAALAVAIDQLRLFERLAARGSRRRHRLAAGIGTFVAVVAVSAGTALLPADLRSMRLLAATYRPVNPAIARVVPPGACVVTDSVSLLLAADRFVSDRPDCPVVVDPFGERLTVQPSFGRQRPPPRPPGSLVARWKHRLAVAQFVVLRWARSLRIPWTPALRRWFVRHFVLVRLTGAAGAGAAGGGVGVLYRHRPAVRPAGGATRSGRDRRGRRSRFRRRAASPSGPRTPPR